MIFKSNNYEMYHVLNARHVFYINLIFILKTVQWGLYHYLHFIKEDSSWVIGELFTENDKVEWHLGLSFWLFCVCALNKINYECINLIILFNYFSIIKITQYF